MDVSCITCLYAEPSKSSSDYKCEDLGFISNSKETAFPTVQVCSPTKAAGSMQVQQKHRRSTVTRSVSALLLFFL